MRVPDALAAIPADRYDVAIVGSGMGGGTLAYALRDTGIRVLIIERGDFIPSEAENWDTDAVFVDHRYQAKDLWQQPDGSWFQPGLVYAVGGNTKVFGASLPRFRPGDFAEVAHADGVSPAWPVSYAEMAPHYAEAERIYGVHGAPERGREDDRDAPFPHPPVPHEPAVQAFADALAARGYTPSHIPLAIDLQPDGRCVRCGTCDAFVCRVHAKGDADVRCVRPALERENVEILTRSLVRRVLTDPAGTRATGVEVERDGQVATVAAGVVVVSAGAINSAALLLRSANEQHPVGLANSSGLVGRNLLVHNNTILLAIHPRRRNDATYTKTLYVNDFYDTGTAEHPFPLGHTQMIGKVREQMVRGVAPWLPRRLRRALTDHSWDWWIFSEDLPDPENRVTLGEHGTIRIRWRPNNVRAHEALVQEVKRMVRKAGYPITLARRTGTDVVSHQAGTARAGADPTSSVLDPWCRTHEVANLFVVDGSFFPSLPVMNPALTIGANALRVAPTIAEAVA